MALHFSRRVEVGHPGLPGGAAWRRAATLGWLLALGVWGAAVHGGEGPGISFRTGILPVLTKAGCNAGSCHGAATGQGGFRLSLLGYDPEEDHDRLARETGGRRIDVGEPESSLLLRKAAGGLDHEGGRRLARGSEGYNRVRDWIAAGAPRDPGDLRVTGVVVEPAQATVEAGGDGVRLTVTAVLSDGRREEVSRWALYTSNDDAVAEVDRDGRVKVVGRGMTSVMVRYGGQVATSRVLVPWGGDAVPGAGGGTAVAAAEGGVDGFMDRALAQLRLPKGPPGGAAEFFRRVHLDVIGRLPTVGETRAFLSGPDTVERRRAVIDGLLERPEFTDYWTLKLADLLRVGARRSSVEVAGRWHGWLRAQVAGRVGMDRVVQALLVAEGDPAREGPAGFYQLANDPRDMAEQVGSMFLGTRIACARCHAHPADRWTQEDYHRFAAFFARVTREGGRIRVAAEGEVEHPKSGQVLAPSPLGVERAGAESFEEIGDRRRVLADWITAPGNPFFARSMVNRVWRHLMGRGLVEPVDDLRPTNPATHPELLTFLAARFESGGYDLRQLVREVVVSAAYQRGSGTVESGGAGAVPETWAARLYARAVPRPLPAEVFLDAVAQVTGVDERFNGVPEGTRAVQLAGPVVGSMALDVLGRCSRERACDAGDGGVGGGLAQALHLIQGGTIQGRLGAGTVAVWLERSASDAGIVEDLWLRAFGRWPRPEEREHWEGMLKAAANRREAVEDLMWTVLNSGEFAFNH